MPRTIAPGEKWFLSVTLAPSEGEFAIHQPCELLVARFRHPIHFAIRGRCMLPYPGLVDTGAVGKGSPVEVLPRNVIGPARLRVARAETGDSRISADLRPGGVLDVSFTGLYAGASFDTPIDLFFDEPWATRRQRIWVRGSVRGGLIGDPADISFGLIRSGDFVAAREFRVACDDGTPVPPLEFEFDRRFLSVETVRADAGVMVLRVSLLSSSSRKVETGIHLTAEGGNRRLTIPVSGTIE